MILLIQQVEVSTAANVACDHCDRATLNGIKLHSFVLIAGNQSSSGCLEPHHGAVECTTHEACHGQPNVSLWLYFNCN